MNILNINASDTSVGGASRVALDLHNEFQKLGHNSTLFVGKKTSSSSSIIEIKNSLFRRGLARIFSTDISFFDSDKILLSHEFKKADVVLCHNLHGWYFNLTTLKKISNLKPTFWLLHDMWALTPHAAHTESRKISNGLYCISDRKLYPKTLWNNDYYLSRKKNNIYKDLKIELITPSIWLKKLAHKTCLGTKKIHYIPNGIDLDKFKYNNSALRLNYQFSNAPLVLFVGADSVTNVFKGFRDFLLVHRIIKNNNDIQFVCLGAKKDGFIENIRLIQATANKDQISEIMSCADVLVMSSSYENFPLVMLEALAIGVPVVSYKIGGIPELLSRSEDSILIEPGNVELLAKGILDVLSRKNETNKALRRAKNRLLVASKCDIKNIAKKYINMFQNNI